MKMLIISDIHANLAALQAVVAAETDSNFIVCLGDLVDYGPQPLECVDLVADLASHVVQGNHDYAVGNDADPHCSLPYQHLADITRKYTLKAMDTIHSHYLSNLPLRKNFVCEGARVSCVHAAPTDPLFRYLLPSAADGEWTIEAQAAHYPDLLLLGHTHLPMIRHVGSTTIVNPGSVGQPKGGDPRAAYAIWEDGQITLKQAEYDIGRTADAYKDVEIPPEDAARLIAILRSGGTDGP